MALSIENQMTATAQQYYESQQAWWMDVGSKLLESLTKLYTLNMSALSDMTNEAVTMFAQVLNAKAPQDYLSPRKPNLEKILTYGRNVGNILARIQAVLGNAIQTQINETSRLVRGMMDTLMRFGPGGADAFGFMKSAFGKSQDSYKQWTGAAKDAAEETADEPLAGAKKTGAHPRQDNGRDQE